MSINGQGRVGIRSIAVPSTPSIITNGLILNLDATDPASYPGTGTTWTDLSGGGHNVTLINGPSYNSANGGYLQFDGINDRGQGFGINPKWNHTISMWFKTTVNNNGWLLEFPNDIGGGPLTDFLLQNASGRMTSYVYGFDSSGRFITLNYDQNYKSGSWINVTKTLSGVNVTNNGTYADSGTAKMYINGNLVDTKAINYVTLPVLASGEFNIGAFGAIGYYTKADISQVLAYNRTLSDTEVFDNYTVFKNKNGY